MGGVGGFADRPGRLRTGHSQVAADRRGSELEPQDRGLDDRFRSATVDDYGYVISHFHRVDNPARWWWRRYPRVLAGATWGGHSAPPWQPELDIRKP